MQTEPSWFDHIMGTASHLVRRHLLTVIAQTHTNTFAQAFDRQGNELVVAQLISMANDVGAGFIDPEHHQHPLFFGERISVEKGSYETAHQGEISGVAAELDLLFFHRARRTEQTLASNQVWNNKLLPDRHRPARVNRAVLVR